MSRFLSIYSLLITIFSPARSVAVKLISSKIFSIIVWSLLAPIFSTVEFTSDAILAIASIPSFENSKSTFSVLSNALYCFIKLLSGSLRILLKSSLVKASSSTLIGSLPWSSGNKSDGLASWKAPEAINKIWSVLIGPYFVLTVVPSINGNRSRWTPSLETSPPALSVLAEILSISSKKTIPLFSVEFFADFIILSSSINLSDSSFINISWDS